MSGMVFVGWLQSQAINLPPLEDVWKWTSQIGFYSGFVWLLAEQVKQGKSLAFLKGNVATKDALSSAVDKIRNDVQAANLEHRIAVATELDELEADVRLLKERRKPRGNTHD